MIARNKGSVGNATRIQGKSLTFVFGYHDKTTRANMANDKKFKKGPRKSAVGCTHGSVAAVSNDDADEEEKSRSVVEGRACRAVVVEPVMKVRGGEQNAATQDSQIKRQPW